MIEERFDAIVVGAGPSGNAAAYTMAKEGLKVLQLERGEYPGSKNVQGAILYANALEKLIPDFREDAPLERHIIEQRLWTMDDTSYVGMHYRSEDFNEERPNRYTIIRAQFDKWFSRKFAMRASSCCVKRPSRSFCAIPMGKSSGEDGPRRRDSPGRRCDPRRGCQWACRAAFGSAFRAQAGQRGTRCQGDAFSAKGGHREPLQSERK